MDDDDSNAAAVQIISCLFYLFGLIYAGYVAQYILWKDLVKWRIIPVLMCTALITSITFDYSSLLTVMPVCSADRSCAAASGIITAISDTITVSTFGLAQVIRASSLCSTPRSKSAVYAYFVLPLLYPTVDIAWILSTIGMVSSDIPNMGYAIANALLPINAVGLDGFIVYSMTKGHYADHFSKSAVQRWNITLLIVASLIAYICASITVVVNPTLGYALTAFFWQNELFVFCKISDFIANVLNSSSRKSATLKPVMHSKVAPRARSSKPL